MQSSGERNHVRDVFDFAAFDFAIFGLVVAMRKKLADGCDTRAAVGLTYHFVWNEPVLERPAVPNTGDGGCGIDKDAIHVEENGTALY